MDKTKFRICKTFISRTNQIDSKERIIQASLSGNGGYICVSNMRMIIYACENAEYNQLMINSFMNLPDGRPLSWCGKLWGLKDVENSNGPALFKTLLSSGDKKLKHYLLGDTQEVLDEIVGRYGKDSNIVGAESLPFASVEEFDYKGIAERVKASGANIVWTAMTAPKQDIFDQRMFKLLPNIVFIGVGRAFRLSINMIKEAPVWAQKLGIGGLFIGRKKLYQRVLWYIKQSFVLMYYFAEIIIRRISGKQYYE